MVAHERDSTNWSKSRLSCDIGHLRRFPSTDSACEQLWNAPGVPVLDWFLRITRPCHWWRFGVRHLHPGQARIRHGSLGYRRHLRANSWTACRRFRSRVRPRWRRHYRAMDMADLGVDVDQRLLPRLPLLLPTRDERQQHPRPPHGASP